MSKDFDKNIATIVVPTYEKHFKQFSTLLTSINRRCLDKENLRVIVVIESKNYSLFQSVISGQDINVSVVTTEEVLAGFEVLDKPTEFLMSVGKFTFQSIKKIGGLLKAQSEWSIILDSETVFFKNFRVKELVKDYAARKYIFYSRTASRGPGWVNSLVDVVTKNCGNLLNVSSGDRCYMELNVWFYESAKVHEWVATLENSLREFLAFPSPEKPVFENVLYYLFIEKYYQSEYKFLDFDAEWKRLVPEEISGRYDLGTPHMSYLGADHATYTLRSEEVPSISGFYKEYAIPFLRVEPFHIDGDQLAEYEQVPGVVAFVASSHLAWVKKKIAVCISGDFGRAVESRFLGPLGWIRNTVSFLTGCECDLFIHGWRSPDEAIILDALSPKAYLFEEKPKREIKALMAQLKCGGQNPRGDKDAGGLADLYSMKRCIELVEESGGDYDFVLKLSPKLYIEPAFFEILRGITLEGDANEDAIYVPRHYHSQGVNEHIALGGLRPMSVYMRTYEAVSRDTKNQYLGSGIALLKAALDCGAKITPVDIRYAHMGGEDYYSFENVARAFARQDSVAQWQFTVDDFPSYSVANEFFADKLKCVEFIYGHDREISDLFVYTKSGKGGDGYDISSLSWRNGNPNADLTMIACNDRGSNPVIFPTRQPVSLSDQGLYPAELGRRYVFFYQDQASSNFMLVEWRYREGKFNSMRVEIDPGMVTAAYRR